METEADVEGEGNGVVGVELLLYLLGGEGGERHFEPVGGEATGEIVEGCQTCGLIDGQILAVEGIY